MYTHFCWALTFPLSLKPCSLAHTTSHNQQSKKYTNKIAKARIEGTNKVRAIQEQYRNAPASYSPPKPSTDRSNPLYYLSSSTRKLLYVCANANGMVKIVAPPNQHLQDNEQQLQPQNNSQVQLSKGKLSLKQKKLSIINKILSK